MPWVGELFVYRVTHDSWMCCEGWTSNLHNFTVPLKNTRLIVLISELLSPVRSQSL